MATERRITILNESEIEGLFGPPLLNLNDQRYLFALNDAELTESKRIRERNQKCMFVLLLGYFKLKPVTLIHCDRVLFFLYSNRQSEDIGGNVSFADRYPLLLIGEGSLSELNRRSPVLHSMDQFRTNLVVSDAEPFAEDSWKRIKIGEVELEVAGPCSRCSMTTVDLETDQLRPSREPLRTLSQFRSDQNGV